MKDEIKEILEELKEKNETYKECSENGIIENEYYKSHILLDYITNLQEENERLKEEQNENPLRGIFAQVTDDDLLRNNGAMYSELEDYKSRIDKAIEYINKNIVINFDKVGFDTNKIAGIVVDKLLEILQGGGKE